MTGGNEVRAPLVTIAVPSLNQGQFLDQALTSIFSQGVPVEVMLADGGSTDNTCEIIEKWQAKLAWWCSEPDGGQAAAINKAISRGSAPFVCWLNADDTYLPDGLPQLLKRLQGDVALPAVYGRVWNTDEYGRPTKPYWTGPFSEWRLAQHCFISQPGTLMRREVWEAVDGVDENLHLAMDYDLWWKILRRFGPLAFVPEFVATNRVHSLTKTASQRREHYREAMEVVRRHTGGVPLKWYLAWPWAVWLRSRLAEQQI
ncbi:MAG: glycosyltransferase [Sulfuricella sp.]|nr:glycosyltransferase [Sulfuricella sp.]